MARKWLPFEAVEHIVGKDAAHALCEALGGQSWYIPGGARGVEHTHPIAAAVGLEAMEALCAAFGPGTVTFSRPRGVGSRKPEIILRLEDGLSCREVARELGVTERYVQRIRKDLGKDLGPEAARPGLDARTVSPAHPHAAFL